MTDLIHRLRTKAPHPYEGNRVVTDLLGEAADEVERLRDVLRGIELLTATGDGLEPDHCIEVHVLAAEGRSDDPAAWRADPAVIERLRAAMHGHKKEG